MLKRAFDIVFSLLGLFALAPIFATIGFLIRREDGGPAFYRGVRVGRRGRLFLIYKFRTMIVNAEQIGGTSTSQDDARITKIGRFIRAHKLDELPQLFNVFRGEMSFVGPRPQVQWAVDLYSPREKLLLSVKPGISDYASIVFKNEAEILKGSPNPDQAYLAKIAPEKIRLGLKYVEHHSFWIDLQIIQRTIIEIFKK